MKNLSTLITATSLFTFSFVAHAQAADLSTSSSSSTVLPAPSSSSNVYSTPSNLSTQGKINSDVNGNDQSFKKISLTDDDVAQKVRLSIKNDLKLSSNAKKVEVAVNKGNVSLKGYVASEDEKSQVGSLARQVSGVKSVSNNLVVSHSR